MTWRWAAEIWADCADEARELKQALLRLEETMIKRNGYVDSKKLSAKDAARRKALLEGRLIMGGEEVPPEDAFVGAMLTVRHDPDTERWVVSLVSRTSREDVPVAWKTSEAGAVAWAQNYGVRK